MPTFNPNEPQNGETVDADLLRAQLNALNDKIDALPAPVAESDPIVGAVTGLVKADGAGHIAAAILSTDYVKTRDVDIGRSGIAMLVGDGTLAKAWPGMDYVEVEQDPVVGQVNGIVKSNGVGVITAASPGVDYLPPVPTANGTYPIANDGVTSGQLTSLTITNGLITAVTVVP